MADIVFTSDIKIDTKEAEKSIAHLARQVDAVFSKTSNMMAQAIKTNSFGFSQYTSNYAGGIDALNDILKGLKPKAPRKNASKGAKAAYASALKTANFTENEINRLKNLSDFMQKLSRYDNLYDDIVGLRKSVVGGTIASETGLGRYNVKQRFSNSLLGLLYGYRGMYPGIVTEDALEISEKHRDRNRKTGSQSRSELRYTQDKEYWQKAYDRARNYMLLDSNDTLLNQINEIYGMGMEPTSKSKPRTVNQKAKDLMTVWAEKGISAQRHKEALESGNLSKGERAYHLEWYKKDMAAFIKLQQKLFPEEKAIAENLKKLNASDVLKFKGPNNTTSGLGSIVSAAAIAKTGMDMLESYWGESISRNVYASKLAYYNRWKMGGGLAGGIGGGILGGLLGGAAAGAGAGAASTAWSGPWAAAGATVGAIGGAVYGIYKSIMAQSDIKSADTMVNRIRNQAMFGSEYNSWFAQGLAEVTGGDAMPELADRAMSLRARMTLGQVGEQEMLYMSMMPNYYAALMAGMTGPQLMNIYKRDLDAIGDPSMKYLVGQAIGGTNAYAAANNPHFNMAYGVLGGESSYYEAKTRPLDAGYMNARADVARRNIEKGWTEINKTAERADEDFYTATVPTSSKNVTFVNVINLDGEEIKRDVKTADEVYTDDMQLYSVGG